MQNIISYSLGSKKHIFKKIALYLNNVQHKNGYIKIYIFTSKIQEYVPLSCTALDMITWRLAWRTPIGSWRGQRSPVPMTMRPGDSHATIGWQWTRGTGELTGICTLNRSDRQKIASQFFCSFQNRSSYMCIVLLLKYITQQLASPSRKTIAYFKPTLSHPTNYLPLSIF